MKREKYQYLLPRDRDRVRVEALALGSMTALQHYPTWRTREIIETETRAGLVLLKKPQYTNDFAALCSLFIPYCVGGYEDRVLRYQKNPQEYEEHQMLLAQKGWAQLLMMQKRLYAQHLLSIQQEMQQQMGVC